MRHLIILLSELLGRRYDSFYDFESPFIPLYPLACVRPVMLFLDDPCLFLVPPVLIMFFGVANLI